MRFWLLFTGFLNFVACSLPTTFVVPEYRGKKVTGGNLAIVLPEGSLLQIINWDDVTDDLGQGKVDLVYRASFDTLVKNRLWDVSTFYKIVVKPIVQKPSMERKTFTINKDDVIQVKLPPEGKSIEFDSFKADCVLLIESIIVTGSEETPPGFSQGPYGGIYHARGEQKMLTQQVIFALWDNVKGQVVTYGRINAKKAPGFFGMTRGTWEATFNQMASEFVKGTPWQKAY